MFLGNVPLPTFLLLPDRMLSKVTINNALPERAVVKTKHQTQFDNMYFGVSLEPHSAFNFERVRMGLSVGPTCHFAGGPPGTPLKNSGGCPWTPSEEQLVAVPSSVLCSSAGAGGRDVLLGVAV